MYYRVRQKEAEEEERSRKNMEDRMQAILSLKGNIETNKVGMSSFAEIAFTSNRQKLHVCLSCETAIIVTCYWSTLCQVAQIKVARGVFL